MASFSPSVLDFGGCERADRNARPTQALGIRVDCGAKIAVRCGGVEMYCRKLLLFMVLAGFAFAARPVWSVEHFAVTVERGVAAKTSSRRLGGKPHSDLD